MVFLSLQLEESDTRGLVSVLEGREVGSMKPEAEAATRKRLAAAKIENMENEQHENIMIFLNPQVKNVKE